MESNKISQYELSKELEELNVKDVDSFIKFLSGDIEELVKKAGMCPEVDKEGRSECPFADDLYAQKEEMEKKVVNGLNKLRRYMELVDREIERFYRNLNQILADNNALHFKQAKEKYTDAMKAIEFQLEKFKQRRKALLDLSSKAEKALNFARSKKWPLGKPQEKFRPPSFMAGGPTRTTTSGYQSPSPVTFLTPWPSVKSEIKSLMSLGPLSRSAENKGQFHNNRNRK